MRARLRLPAAGRSAPALFRAAAALHRRPCSAVGRAATRRDAVRPRRPHRVLPAHQGSLRTLGDLVTALRGRTGPVPLLVERQGKKVQIEIEPERRAPVLERRAAIIDGALIRPPALPTRLFARSGVEPMRPLNLPIAIHTLIHEILGRLTDSPRRLRLRRMAGDDVVCSLTFRELKHLVPVRA